jgi:vesicle-associated membrane protein 4
MNTVSVTREDVWRESQRGDFQTLNGIADSLATSSQESRGDAYSRFKKMLWRSVRWRLCLVGSIVILLVVIVVVVL